MLELTLDSMAVFAHCYQSRTALVDYGNLQGLIVSVRGRA